MSSSGKNQKSNSKVDGNLREMVAVFKDDGEIDKFVLKEMPSIETNRSSRNTLFNLFNEEDDLEVTDLNDDKVKNRRNSQRSQGRRTLNTPVNNNNKLDRNSRHTVIGSYHDLKKPTVRYLKTESMISDDSGTEEDEPPKQNKPKRISLNEKGNVGTVLKTKDYTDNMEDTEDEEFLSGSEGEFDEYEFEDISDEEYVTQSETEKFNQEEVKNELKEIINENFKNLENVLIKNNHKILNSVKNNKKLMESVKEKDKLLLENNRLLDSVKEKEELLKEQENLLKLKENEGQMLIEQKLKDDNIIKEEIINLKNELIKKDYMNIINNNKQLDDIQKNNKREKGILYEKLNFLLKQQYIIYKKYIELEANNLETFNTLQNKINTLNNSLSQSLNLKIDSLNSKIENLEINLNSKLDNLDPKLDELTKKFEGLNHNLNPKFETLNQNFNGINEYLTSKIESLNPKFYSMEQSIEGIKNKIDDVNMELTSKLGSFREDLDTYNGEMNSKFDEITPKIDLMDETLNSKLNLIQERIETVETNIHPRFDTLQDALNPRFDTLNENMNQQYNNLLSEKMKNHKTLVQKLEDEYNANIMSLQQNIEQYIQNNMENIQNTIYPKLETLDNNIYPKLDTLETNVRNNLEVLHPKIETLENKFNIFENNNKRHKNMVNLMNIKIEQLLIKNNELFHKLSNYTCDHKCPETIEVEPKDSKTDKEVDKDMVDLREIKVLLQNINDKLIKIDNLQTPVNTPNYPVDRIYGPEMPYLNGPLNDNPSRPMPYPVSPIDFPNQTLPLNQNNDNTFSESNPHFGDNSSLNNVQYAENQNINNIEPNYTPSFVNNPVSSVNFTQNTYSESSPYSQNPFRENSFNDVGNRMIKYPIYTNLSSNIPRDSSNITQAVRLGNEESVSYVNLNGKMIKHTRQVMSLPEYCNNNKIYY